VFLLLASCGATAPARPDIPALVSPGWKLSSLDKSASPPGLSSQGTPQCWKAVYTGPGSADAWLCWYRVSGNAFDAVQRARAEAQTVKFQEGQYFVLVKWNNVNRTDLTTLVRALQKALQQGSN
jgi:hypothetical protein